jgi:hypothetical protein
LSEAALARIRSIRSSASCTSSSTVRVTGAGSGGGGGSEGGLASSTCGRGSASHGGVDHPRSGEVSRATARWADPSTDVMIGRGVGSPVGTTVGGFHGAAPGGWLADASRAGSWRAGAIVGDADAGAAATTGGTTVGAGAAAGVGTFAAGAGATGAGIGAGATACDGSCAAVGVPGAFAHAGMRLGSSHSPHHRHLAAASWIGSAQYGQGFTTG